jgi:predicted dehydrogenase
MKSSINRRRFIQSTLTAGAFTIVPRHVLGGRGHVAPSERITLAHIGVGTQGIKEIGGLLEDERIQIVAVCDPNRSSNDYVEWGKNGIRNQIRRYLDKPTWREGHTGCPGGREVGREIVNTYYANHRTQEQFKGCAAYADFRELFQNEKDIDAVKVMTPDHLHATVAIAAMKKGMHVLMHKPVANRLHEGRLVLDTVHKTKKATHLLAYGSGVGNGRIAGKIKQGVIGPLREIHNWTNRPVWPQYTEISTDRPAIPKGFDWNLWLGPEKKRPYHPHYTHTVFRGWYDFGGGSMADMGIYSLWPVFTALGLPVAESAQAWQTHTCVIEDNVSRTKKNDFAYPIACSLRFHFAAQASRPALDLFWYDGGMKPRLPREIEAHDIEMGREGILYLGDKGAILAGFHGQSPRLFIKGQNKPLGFSENELRDNTPENRSSLWVNACLGGDSSPGSFLDAASITDTVNLGTVALRTGKKVVFDSEAMTITNAPEANKYLTRDYRKGWELS